jgi:hypothetical protein
VRNNKVGMLLYGTCGSAATPFAGGTLCLAPPIRRAPSMSAGGNPGPGNDCSGTYAIDFNAFAASHPVFSDLRAVGTEVSCQLWGRDQGFEEPNNVMLSDALRFTIGIL